MPDETDLDPDEVRQGMHSAVEKIRQGLPGVIEPEPAPSLLSESGASKLESGDRVRQLSTGVSTVTTVVAQFEIG